MFRLPATTSVEDDEQIADSFNTSDLIRLSPFPGARAALSREELGPPEIPLPFVDNL